MDRIEHLIKKNGQRLTIQKKKVIAALRNKPQTVLEILEAVSIEKRGMDKATIYRILNGLKKLGAVREIHLENREAFFELADCGHHHHLVCEQCGCIEDVALCEDALLKEVAENTSFRVNRHSLEFFGMCGKCQMVIKKIINE